MSYQIRMESGQIREFSKVEDVLESPMMETIEDVMKISFNDENGNRVRLVYMENGLWLYTVWSNKQRAYVNVATGMAV